jgi:hypothetical protein
MTADPRASGAVITWHCDGASRSDEDFVALPLVASQVLSELIAAERTTPVWPMEGDAPARGQAP